MMHSIFEIHSAQGLFISMILNREKKERERKDLE